MDEKKTLTLPIHKHPQLHASPYKQKTSITFPTQRYNIIQHTKGKKTSSTMALDNKHSHRPPHMTTDIKTNLCYINTSIAPMHLSTRGNNKIICTSPPHICSSEETLHRLNCHTLAQLRTNKSYLHKVDTKSHDSPLCPLCNTHTQTHIISLTAPSYGFVEDSATGPELLAR